MADVSNVTSPEGQDVTQPEGTVDTVPDNKSEIQLPSSIEELQMMLQKEGDKRVSSAKKTWEAKQKEVIENEKKEAVKLAKMSAAEREKAEYEKEKADFEAQKEQLAKEQLKMQTVKELNTEGLPIEFADFLMSDTAENVNDNINVFKEAWNNALEKAIKERIATPVPKKGTSNLNNKSTSGFMAAIKSKRAR